MRKVLFSLLLLPLFLFSEEIARSPAEKKETPAPKQNTAPEQKELEHIVLFIPPKGWSAADSAVLPSTVQFLVFGKGAHPFPPSMNLTTEPFGGSLKQYLGIVKNMNAAQGYEWKDLGTIETESGPASLSQVDTKSEWGEVRMMHVIFIKDNRIFNLTSAALKEEFSKFYKDFFTAVGTLRINKDILDMVKQPQKKTELKTAYNKVLNQWKDLLMQKKKEQPTVEIDSMKDQLFESKQFQTQVWTSFKDNLNKKYSDMGPEWQDFVLQKIENDLFDMNL